MAVIPEKIYQLVKKRLQERHVLVQRAEIQLMEAQSAAYGCSAPPMDAPHVSGGGTGNRTQSMAFRVMEAEKALDEARKWLDVFRLLDAAFPFPGTVEGQIANLIFEQGCNQAQVCLELKCDRQTIRRRMDNYVIYGALIAASRGLVEIGRESDA